MYWDTSWLHEFHDHVIVQASNWPLITEDQFQSKLSLCGIYGRKSDNGTGFSLSTFVLFCHPHSINAVHLFFIHLPSMQYNPRHPHDFNFMYAAGYKSNTLRCLKLNQFNSMGRPITYETVYSCKPQLHVSKSEISSS